MSNASAELGGAISRGNGLLFVSYWKEAVEEISLAPRPLLTSRAGSIGRPRNRTVTMIFHPNITFGDPVLRAPPPPVPGRAVGHAPHGGSLAGLPVLASRVRATAGRAGPRRYPF